jgi:HPt (histidine-containing phosphotransfer) domain-containing protein
MVQRTAMEPGQSPGQNAHLKHPIDRVHLAKQTLGDKGLELEVLRMFDDTMRVYFTRLETSTTRDALLNHLHTIRGAAAGIGATTIALLARRAEADLRDGLPVDPERIDDLEMAITECSAFIEQLLAQEASHH